MFITTGVVGIIAYLGFIGIHVSPFGSNADASGYLNHAKLIQSGQTRVTLPTLAAPDTGWAPYLQVPLGFKLSPDESTLVPTYPVGYPLHLAAVGTFAPLSLATPIVNTTMVLLSGILLWRFARSSGLPAPWGVAAVAVLWSSPLFIYHATQPMSDVCAMVWSLATLCAIQQANQKQGAGWFLGAGACLAIAVLVRPTNALLVFAMLYLIGARLRPLGWVLAGGAPGAALFFWYNHHLYGAASKSGYGDIFRFLDWSYFPAGASHFAQGLALHFSPVVPLLFLGVVLAPKSLRNLLLLWVVPSFVFYACYSFSDDNWWYLRFLLPVMPALIVGGLFFARTQLQRISHRQLRVALNCLGMAVIIGWEVYCIPRQHTLVMKRGEIIYQQAGDWAHAHIEPHAIIIAHQTSGALHYAGMDHFLVRSDLVTPSDSAVMFATARARGIPVYAALFLHENDSTPSKVGGNWKLLAQFGVIKIYAVDPFQ